MMSPLTAAVQASERGITAEVPPAQEECFGETLQDGDTDDVDYQMANVGRYSEIAINSRLIKPDRVPIVADFR